jgi:hypothetical protein
MQIAGLKLPSYNGTPLWIGDIDIFVFKEAVINGTINLKSKSFIFLAENNPITLNLSVINEDTKHTFSNVTYIVIKGSNGISFTGVNLKLMSGTGFYMHLEPCQSKITVLGGEIDVNFIDSDGKLVTFNNNSTMELSVFGNFTLYIREPYIVIDGVALFKEAIVWGLQATRNFKEIFKKDICRDDLLINGATSFASLLSGTFAYATDFRWDGTVNLVNPIVEKPEWFIFKEPFSPVAWLVALVIILVKWNLTLKKQ